MRSVRCLFVVLVALAGVLPSAHALTPAERRIIGYAASPLPACASSEVLGYVSTWFSSREATYWGSGLQIGAFDHVKERGLRPWGANFVPRRFCSARAYLNDGRMRHVNYFVRESIGPIGNTWEVIWCVVGLDRHRTYAPACEQATAW